MESSFFPSILAFGWIGILLLAGALCRAKIKFLQYFMIPSGLIGGVIGFILMRFDIIGAPTVSEGWKLIDTGAFNTLTFHLFALTFVGIGLLKQAKDPNEAEDKLKYARGGLWMALMFSVLFAAQSLLGGAIFKVYQMMAGGDWYFGSGYLLGAGYAQGPGQTQAYATIWVNSYGISKDVIDIGLAFAAMGFVVSAFIGVPLTRWGLTKGYVKENSGKLPLEYFTGILKAEKQTESGKLVTHPANMDSLGFHMGLFMACYGLAYVFGCLWTKFGPASLSGLGYGFVWCWGMVVGVIARRIMDATKCDFMLDPGTVKRLTNASVDFLICGVVMGIKPQALEAVFVPFIIACILGAVLTAIFCLLFGRYAPDHGFSRAMLMFGWATGTSATALMLLRLVDPEFKTPLAIEMGFMTVFTIFGVLMPLTFGLPFAPVEGFPWVWICVGLCICYPIIMYFLKLIRRQPQW